MNDIRVLKYGILSLAILVSLFMHVEHFGKELISMHVWRQTQTQSTINNFYEEDMNIFQPRRNDRGAGAGIFRMEFPLMQWLVAGVYKIAGKHLMISRVFMFIIGLFSVFGIYNLLYQLFGRIRPALLAAWAFSFSPSFYYYTINPLPDNLALCFSIWGLFFFFKWYNQPKPWDLVLSGFLLALGALCKLPFIVYFIVPFSHFVIAFFKKEDKWKVGKQGGLVHGFILLPIAWYAMVIPEWKGNVVVKGMLDNTDTNYQIVEYLWHNLISTLPELLINYASVLFFLSGFYFLWKNKAFFNERFRLLVALSFGVLAYYLFEINTIAKVHDYYLFPFLPLIFILVGYGGDHLLRSKNKGINYLARVALVLLPITCYLRMEVRWSPEEPGFNKDLLIHKEALRKAVPNDALVVAGNDESRFIFFYYIDKKGWGFQDNQLKAESLHQMILKGAKYIYTDAMDLEHDKELNQYFDQLILSAGSIKVYRLRATE